MDTKYHQSNLAKPLLAYQNTNTTMQDNLDNELEETMSLCDLPIFGYDTNCSTTDSEDSMKCDESFEFFCEEWLRNDKDSNFFPNKDIEFCGNLILPKQPISIKTEDFKKNDHGATKVDLDSSLGRRSEFGKLMSMNKGRNHVSGQEKKRVFPTSASLKSRWYYNGFGLARVPVEMDLSAIKSRQNRHRKNLSSGGQGGSGKEESGGFWYGKGLGRLIRDLSCDGQTQANSMVKASLVYLPRV